MLTRVAFWVKGRQIYKLPAAAEIMGSKGKADVVRQAFLRCSHQEQVELVYEFTDYLKRDFLTLLPPELSEIILSHLPVSCVLGACVQVSQ